MGIQSSQRAIALAIFGILVSLVLAMLSAARASSTAIVVSAAATILLIVLLYVPVMRGFYRDFREQRQRGTLRDSHKLRLVAECEADLSPEELPDGVYGYEEISAVAGLRPDGPYANQAKIKPDRTDPQGYPYPLEVHKFDRDTWLVGYVAANDGHVADTAEPVSEFSLWMRRTRDADVLVEIPLSRVDGERSLGDRSWDSSAKNIFRLLLTMGAAESD